MGSPPAFVAALGRLLRPTYLWSLQMNRPGAPAQRPDLPTVLLEFRLKDSAGNMTSTVKLPDDAVNPWVRHQQQLLIQQLADDEAIQARAGETIPPPGQPARTVTIWDIGSGRSLALKAVPEHLIPRDRPVFGPADTGLVLVRSYARYLCRTKGAVAVEVIRHSRESGQPPGRSSRETAQDATDEMIANFGEFSQ
jgi:hypothetical protein